MSAITEELERSEITFRRPDHGRMEGKVRVYADMCADVSFHFGHAQLCLNGKKAIAKELNKNIDEIDFVVGLLSDDMVAAYKRSPILTLHERTQGALMCCYVDEVIADVPLITTMAFLKRHDLDFVIHGDDYNDDQIQKYYGDAKSVFRLVPYCKDISTSRLIQRIQSTAAGAHANPTLQKEGAGANR